MNTGLMRVANTILLSLCCAAQGLAAEKPAFVDPEASTYEGMIIPKGKPVPINVPAGLAVNKAVAADKAKQATIAKLVRSLGANDYWERERATKALLKIGEGAVPALTAAKKSTDLEIATRAETILQVLTKLREKRPGVAGARTPKPGTLSARLHAEAKLPDSVIRQQIIDSIGDKLTPRDMRYRGSTFTFAAPERALAILFHIYDAQKKVAYKQRIMRAIAKTCQPLVKERVRGSKALAMNARVVRTLLARLADPDPFVRFWAVRAAAGLGVVVPENTMKTLLEDTNIRTRHEARKYLPRLLATAPVPGDGAWADLCVKTAAKGDLLTRATALRALQDFALTYCARLVERYAKASDAEKPGLEWALMQVPDLPIWIDHFQRSELGRRKGPDWFGQLLSLHQGWRFRARADKLSPDDLDERAFRMIDATRFDQDWATPLTVTDWGKHEVLRGPLIALACQKRSGQYLAVLLKHDKRAVQVLVTQEMHGFPAQLRTSRILPLMPELDATPQLLAATKLAYKWMMEDRYLLFRSSEKVKTGTAEFLRREPRQVRHKEDASARKRRLEWVRACAMNATSEDLPLSAGAMNALLWSDELGAKEIVERLMKSKTGSRTFRILLGLGVLHAFVPEELAGVLKRDGASAAGNPGIKALQAALKEREGALLDVIDLGFQRSYGPSEKKMKQANLERHGAAFDALYVFVFCRNYSGSITRPLQELFSKRLKNDWNGLLLSQMTLSSRAAMLIPETSGDAFIPYVWRGLSTRQRYTYTHNHMLFGAAARLQMAEAIPVLIRHAVKDTNQPSLGIRGLGALGCPEATIDLEAFWRYMRPDAGPQTNSQWVLCAETVAAQFRLGELRGLARALAMRPHCTVYSVRRPILRVAKDVTGWPAAWTDSWNSAIIAKLEASFLKWLPGDITKLKWDPKAKKYSIGN
jgi:hypothetical protein